VLSVTIAVGKYTSQIMKTAEPDIKPAVQNLVM
jgi:hypothetical protein